MGTHRAEKPRRAKARRPIGLIALLAAGAVLLVGGGGYAAISALGGDKQDDSTAGCAANGSTVVASPEIAPTLDSLIAKGGCSDVTVQAVPAIEIAQRLEAGGGAPEFWVPDSSLWAEGVPGKSLAKSLATSPVVVATRGANPPVTWSDVITSEAYNPGNPLVSTASVVPLIGAVAEGHAAQESEQTIQARMVNLAGRFSNGPAAPADAKRAAAVAEDGGIAVVPESVAIKAGITDLSAPQDSTLFLDYPLLQVAGKDGAGAVLKKVLDSAAAHRDLSKAGFRVASGKPSELSAQTVQPMKLDDPTVVSQTLEAWGQLVVPSQNLTVIDVSGSMGEIVPEVGVRRMDILKEAAATGASLFPNSSSMGLWEFGQEIDGKTDYRELAPIRGFTEQVGGATQREAILGAIQQMEHVPGSATGLYDTTWAAYREAKRAWRADAVNTVVILTDGRNEDPGSLTLNELLANINDATDPEKPVYIVGIGISADADGASLKKIADATHGYASVAQNPRDIMSVFQEASAQVNRAELARQAAG